MPALIQTTPTGKFFSPHIKTKDADVNDTKRADYAFVDVFIQKVENQKNDKNNCPDIA